MSKAVNAHERWLDSIGDSEPEHEVTHEVKRFIADVIDRRTHNDDEEVVREEIYAEIVEEYPNIDEYKLQQYLGEVMK